MKLLKPVSVLVALLSLLRHRLVFAEPSSVLETTFVRLEEHLRAVVKSNLIQPNVAHLETLLAGLETQHQVEPVFSQLHSTIKSVLELKQLADDDEQLESSCDNEATTRLLRVLVPNTSRIEPTDGARLPHIVAHYLRLVVEHCEPKVERHLDEAIESSNAKDSHARLSRFLTDSPQFLRIWRDQFQPDLPLRFGQLSSPASWSSWPPEGRLSARLILGNLFWLRNESHQFEHYFPSSRKWPRLSEAQLADQLDEHFRLPCAELATDERACLELFYLAARLFRADGFARAFMARRSAEFQRQVFVYEFCQFVNRSPLVETMLEVYGEQVADARPERIVKRDDLL